MNEHEYNGLMKRALTDDSWWEALTKQPSDLEQAKAWLQKAQAQVTADLKIRHAKWGSIAAQHQPGSHEYRTQLQSYMRWKETALGFQHLVQSRLADVRSLNTRNRAQDHAEYMQKQLAHTTNSLADLASLVESFGAGAITASELDNALDELTVPHGGDGTRTLRGLLQDKRAAYKTEVYA